MRDLFFKKLEQALTSESGESKGGHIWEYFKDAREDKKNPNWEYTLRKRFENALDKSDQAALQDSVLSLGELYFAIRPLRKPNDERAAGLIASELLKTFQGPTRTEFKAGLLDEADYPALYERLQEIYLKTVPSLTQRWGKGETAIHPWSWTSKALHFTKPELFPIFDSLASASWKIVIKRLSLKTKQGWPYNYKNICFLYRELWDGFTATQKERIKELVSALRNHFDLPFFSVIDAFDKHFWKAGNNPDAILFADRSDRFGGEMDVIKTKPKPD